MSIRLSSMVPPLAFLLVGRAAARELRELRLPLLAEEVCRDEYEAELGERIGELEGVLKQIRDLASLQCGERWQFVVQLVDAACASPASEPPSSPPVAYSLQGLDALQLHETLGTASNERSPACRMP